MKNDLVSDSLRMEALDPASGDLSSALAAVHAEAPALAAIADRWSTVFRLHSPHATGLYFLGAQIGLTGEEARAFGSEVISVGGTGLDFVSATRSALGETCECLAQVWRPQDTASATCDLWNEGWVAAISGSKPWTFPRFDLVSVTAPDTAETKAVPVDCVFRRAQANRTVAVPWPLSSGCAAGPSQEAAKLRALLELIERDALAMWWLASRPAPAPVPEEAEADQISSHLATLRGVASHRQTWLLDITTEAGIPCIAALSTDRYGYGLACGAAARLSVVEAAKAAINELCQLELAAAFAKLRFDRFGAQALSEDDRRHLARVAVRVHDYALLWPANSTASRPLPPAADLQRTLERLRACGIAVGFVELSRREFAVPVFRALAPGLQPFTDRLAVPRFSEAREQARHRGLTTPEFSIF